MYADRFRDYVFADNTKRLRDDRISLCIAFAVFCWLVFLLGIPERIAAIDSVLVLGGCMVYFAVRYCVSEHQSVSARPLVDFLYRPVTRKLAFVSVLIILCLAPLPQVGAAVIDHRLRVLTRTTPLSSESAAQIAKDLERARRWKVPLSQHLLTDIRDTIKESASQTPESVPLAKPAEALVNYQHEDPRYIASLEDVPAQALADLQQSFTYLNDAYRSYSVEDGQTYLKASVQAITRAITESHGNRTFQATALLGRTQLYLGLGDSQAALADVRTAEALGSLDLGTITLMKGIALAHQANPEDARQAIGLLTLSLQLNDNPTPQALAYEARCLAYIQLGDYQKALPDAQRTVELAGPWIVSRNIGYRFAILCYLGLENYEAALKTAAEYQRIAPSVVADKWLESVQEYPQNPQLVFTRLYKAATTPSNAMPE